MWAEARLCGPSLFIAVGPMLGMLEATVRLLPPASNALSQLRLRLTLAGLSVLRSGAG